MSSDFIAAEVQRIKNKHGALSPEGLAKDMGIIVRYEPMGSFEGCCKGFFVCFCRVKHITVNSDLPEELQRVILMHELAHVVLHGEKTAAFHDFTIFDGGGLKEYEANIFAADYMLSDHEVLQTIKDGLSFFAAAARLNVPPELLDFKFRLMKRRGCKLNESPVRARGNFLKKV